MEHWETIKFLDFKNQILPPVGNIRSDVLGIFFFVQGKKKYVDNFVCNCLSEVLYIVLSKRKIYDDTEIVCSC